MTTDDYVWFRVLAATIRVWMLDARHEPFERTDLARFLEVAPADVDRIAPAAIRTLIRFHNTTP